MQHDILVNLAHIHERIETACYNAGRDSSTVRLLLATKTVQPEEIRIAVDAGECLIGENRMQEYAEKACALSNLNIERHFIGHLQTNKVKEAIKYVNCIQSVDRMELVQKLERRLLAEGKTMDVMVQVNTSFEKSKFGLEPDMVTAFLKELVKYETLKIKGFMTIGLYDADDAKVSPSYRRLREIRDNAIAKGIIPSTATELSMGMSHDLETAIREGATIVRVGSAIFGERVY